MGNSVVIAGGGGIRRLKGNVKKYNKNYIKTNNKTPNTLYYSIYIIIPNAF